MVPFWGIHRRRCRFRVPRRIITISIGNYYCNQEEEEEEEEEEEAGVGAGQRVPRVC